MSNDKFWNATERAEEVFTGDADVTAFRRKMRELGHDEETINDRVAAIHPSLAKAERERGQ